MTRGHLWGDEPAHYWTYAYHSGSWMLVCLISDHLCTQIRTSKEENTLTKTTTSVEPVMRDTSGMNGKTVEGTGGGWGGLSARRESK